MPKPKKGTQNPGGRPVTVIGGERITVLLDGATLEKVARIIKHASFGTRAQVLREALSIGLDQILRRYEKR